MGHMERAWAALMAGDVATAASETQYIEGPNRDLHGLAALILAIHGDNAAGWLVTPNLQLDGKAPRDVIHLDDRSSWRRITALFAEPIALKILDPNFTKRQGR